MLPELALAGYVVKDLAPYRDLDVCQSSGNLFVVSSTENVVAELTPTAS